MRPPLSSSPTPAPALRAPPHSPAPTPPGPSTPTSPLPAWPRVRRAHWGWAGLGGRGTAAGGSARRQRPRLEPAGGPRAIPSHPAPQASWQTWPFRWEWGGGAGRGGGAFGSCSRPLGCNLLLPPPPPPPLAQGTRIQWDATWNSHCYGEGMTPARVSPTAAGRRAAVLPPRLQLAKGRGGAALHDFALAADGRGLAVMCLRDGLTQCVAAALRGAAAPRCAQFFLRHITPQERRTSSEGMRVKVTAWLAQAALGARQRC